MKQEQRLQNKEAKAGFVTPTPVAHLILPLLGAGSCKSFPQAAFSSLPGRGIAQFWPISPHGSGSQRGPSEVWSSWRMGQVGASSARGRVRKGLHTLVLHKFPD